MSVRSLMIFAAIGALVLAVSAVAAADQPPRGAGSRDQKAPRVVSPRKSGSQTTGSQPAGSVKPGDENIAKNPVPRAAEPSSALPRPKSPAVLATKKDAKTGEDVIVITNDDLLRIFGRSHATAQETDYSDFLKKYGNPEGSRRTARQRPPAPTRDERIAELQRQIAQLKRRLLSLHNPLVPRVQPGEADRKAEEGMDNVQRAARVKAQIRALEQQLVQLQSPSGFSRR